MPSTESERLQRQMDDRDRRVTTRQLSEEEYEGKSEQIDEAQ